MAKIDYLEIAADLEKKIRSAIKKANISFKEIVEVCSLGKNEYFIQVNCMETLSMLDVISDVIRAHKYGFVIREEEHIGFFDWESDTYIKDSACVTYGVK